MEKFCRSDYDGNDLQFIAFLINYCSHVVTALFEISSPLVGLCRDQPLWSYLSIFMCTQIIILMQSKLHYDRLEVTDCLYVWPLNWYRQLSSIVSIYLRQKELRVNEINCILDCKTIASRRLHLMSVHYNNMTKMLRFN